MADINLFEVMDRESSLNYFKSKFGVSTDAELQQKLKAAYYEGNALVTDATYDKLFPVDPIGYQVQSVIWPKFTHLVESTAMSKFKKIEDANNLIQTTNFYVQVVEPKLDGINMKLYYEHGKLVHAVTRGSGVEGEDILLNALKFKQVLPSINTKFSMTVIEGEITISANDFNIIKQTSSTEYSNRRNAAAGIARRLDGQNSEYLTFYAYTIYEPVNGKLDKLPVLDCRQKLSAYGFSIPVDYLSTGKTLEQIYADAAQIRDTNEDYLLDGLVIKSRENRFALKFPANTGETTVTGYRWELGTTYKLIPVVLYDTITIGGANYSKASLASAQNYKNTNAPIGSTIEIARANEVIPYLKSVILRSDNPLDIPTECPVCGAPLDWQGAHLVCNNENCGSRFYSKCQRLLAILDIRGFKFATIAELIKLGVVTEATQILTLTPEQLMQSGKSQRVAVKIAQGIKDRLKELSDVAIVFALNLPGISFNTLLELEKVAKAKGKSILQVVELQEQDDYTIVQSVLKAVKANTLIKFMSSKEGREYYIKLKTIMQAK